MNTCSFINEWRHKFWLKIAINFLSITRIYMWNNFCSLHLTFQSRQIFVIFFVIFCNYFKHEMESNGKLVREVSITFQKTALVCGRLTSF